MSNASTSRKVRMVTLGCARNEVDSEELAGRLTADGWRLVSGDEDDPSGAGPGQDQPGQDGAPDVVLVNTCGFVESAKKDSVDTLLAAADTGAKVVAVGCLAERYGAELAEHLPEADAVLGFDHYPTVSAALADVVAGRPIEPHRPVDRRTLLPITPANRPAASADVTIPGHAWAPTSTNGVSGVLRRRLDDSPVAPLKIASGCDRRCSFCAIPSFRGSFVSRPPAELVAEAAWLAANGARELVLVSENSTSYGKDAATAPGWPAGVTSANALSLLLPLLAEVDGIDRIRVSYLQPAELRSGLIGAIAGTSGVARYFDLSFQHASEPLLRRMRRFGSTSSFLALLDEIRALAPYAGVRSNVIVGFPGETEADLAELRRFLTEARLDAVGVFGYSDEDGTEAAGLPDKVPPAEVAERVAEISELVEQLTAQRAEERVGESVVVLAETVESGRAEHQGPEDGACVLAEPDLVAGHGFEVGALVPATVIATEGVDLVVRPDPTADLAGPDQEPP